MKPQQSEIKSETAQEAPDSNYFKELTEFSKNVNQYVIALAGLFKAELIFALQSIPKLVFVTMVILPAIVFVWLSFSAVVYWSVYSITASVLFGLVVLLLLQTTILLCTVWMQRVYINRLKFLYTREQISTLLSGIDKNDHKTDSTEK